MPRVVSASSCWRSHGGLLSRPIDRKHVNPGRRDSRCRSNHWPWALLLNTFGVRMQETAQHQKALAKEIPGSASAESSASIRTNAGDSATLLRLGLQTEQPVLQKQATTMASTCRFVGLVGNIDQAGLDRERIRVRRHALQSYLPNLPLSHGITPTAATMLFLGKTSLSYSTCTTGRSDKTVTWECTQRVVVVG